MSDTLRDRLIAALDPLDHWDAPESTNGAIHSDFDLNPEFRPTDPPVLRDAAVLIPVIDHPEGATVLLTRRADAMTSHSGQVAFPGGRLDPGETPVQAAVREAMEEVGLDAEFIEPLGLSHRYETVTGYVVTPVVALVRPGFTLTLNPAEVAEAFETPLDFLLDPANHLRAFYERAGRKRWFYRIPWQGQDIWGATAGMIRALRARLYGDDPEGAMIGDPASRDGGAV